MLMRLIWLVLVLLHISSSESLPVELPGDTSAEFTQRFPNVSDNNRSDQVNIFLSWKQFSGKVGDQDSTVQLVWRELWSESHENVEFNSSILTHESSTDSTDDESEEDGESESFTEDTAESGVNADNPVELVHQVNTKLFTSTKWEQNETLCQDKVNMYILFDALDRIGKIEFEKLKEFLANLVATKSQRSRIGIITIANKTEIIIPKNPNDKIIPATILGIQNISIGEAMMGTTQLIHDTPLKYRGAPGAPQVIVVFSSTPTMNTEFQAVKILAHLSNFTVVVVEVGNNSTNSQEKVNSAGYFNIASFDQLNPDFLAEFKSYLCTIPQIPKVNETVYDELKKGETRYFSFDVPEKGLVIRFQSTIGSILGSHNYDQNKNMSLNNKFQIKDGDDALSFRFASSSGKSSVLFKIEGDAENTTSLYSVKLLLGQKNNGSEVSQPDDASHTVEEAFTSTNSTKSSTQVMVNNFFVSLMLLVFQTLASVWI